MSRDDGRYSRAQQIGPDAGWVYTQFLIFIVAAVAGPLGLVFPGRPDLPWPRAVDNVVGLAIMVAGIVIAGQGQRDLGRSMRVAPTPFEDAEFVDRGWYGRVRHPLYFAVQLELLGWAVLWSSLPALAVTLVGLAFFSLKARHEERLLLDRYPDYSDYMRRVRWRFIPGVL